MAHPPADLLTSLAARCVPLVLPDAARAAGRGSRPQIGLAYLLARTTDTIADTELVPLDSRLEALARACARASWAAPRARWISATWPASRARRRKRILLERVEEALAAAGAASRRTTAARSATVLDTITSGQELDLQRFAGALGRARSSPCKPTRIWTTTPIAWRDASASSGRRSAARTCFPRAAVDDAFLLADGVRFGKGLQLVNILRDLPADLRQGRCYLPGGGSGSAARWPPAICSSRQQNRGCAPVRPLPGRGAGASARRLGLHQRPARAAACGCAWPAPGRS